MGMGVRYFVDKKDTLDNRWVNLVGLERFDDAVDKALAISKSVNTAVKVRVWDFENDKVVMMLDKTEDRG